MGFAKTEKLFDDEGEQVLGGDKVRFTYGIPPVCVTALVVEQDNGRLRIEVPEPHKPSTYPLRQLRHAVGAWYKVHGDELYGS